MPNSCHVSLSVNGQDQVLTIPHEFALSGTEVLLRKEGLVTANTREFERVLALSLDNWLV